MGEVGRAWKRNEEGGRERIVWREGGRGRKREEKRERVREREGKGKE